MIPSLQTVLIGLGTNLVLAIGAWSLRWLSVSGAISAFIIGIFTFWFTKIDGWLLLMLFFLTANILGKISRSVTKQLDLGMQKKSGRRDWAQVVANGGLAAASALFYGASTSRMALVMFGCAVAASTADTWAVEAGILSKTPPISIATGKPVPPGQSGGVSLLGTFSSLLGSLLIGLAWYGSFADFSDSSWIMCASIIVVSGFLGSVVDSLLGATLQGHYWDPEKNRITEHDNRDSMPLELCRGIRWIDNDVVNFISNLVAVLIGIILTLLVPR